MLMVGCQKARIIILNLGWASSGTRAPILRHFEYKAKLEFNGSTLIVQSNNYLRKNSK